MRFCHRWWCHMSSGTLVVFSPYQSAFWRWEHLKNDFFTDILIGFLISVFCFYLGVIFNDIFSIIIIAFGIYSLVMSVLLLILSIQMKKFYNNNKSNIQKKKTKPNFIAFFKEGYIFLI